MSDLVVVDMNINQGKPSVATTVPRKYQPVKAIQAFIDGGVSIAETMEELKVTKEAVEAAIAYKEA